MACSMDKKTMTTRFGHFELISPVACIQRAGVVSEHLATKRYGEQRERFSQLEGLNGAQSFSCFIWALAILQVMKLTGQVQPGQTAAWTEYWKAGITNSLGPAFGMVALKNITYSAQVGEGRGLCAVGAMIGCTAARAELQHVRSGRTLSPCTCMPPAQVRQALDASAARTHLGRLKAADRSLHSTSNPPRPPQPPIPGISCMACNNRRCWSSPARWCQSWSWVPFCTRSATAPRSTSACCSSAQGWAYLA